VQQTDLGCKTEKEGKSMKSEIEIMWRKSPNIAIEKVR
jgi:hypothetical protein